MVCVVCLICVIGCVRSCRRFYELEVIVYFVGVVFGVGCCVVLVVDV